MRTLQWVIILLLAFGRAQPDNLRLVITVDGALVSIDTQGQDQRLLVRNRCSNRAQSVLADGHSLAFFAGGRKCTMYGMNRLDLNSGEVTRLAPIYGIVSPDGRSVAEKRALYHSRTGPYEIYVWDVATWAERKVGEGRVAFVDDVDMVWSPDSRYLAYEVGYLMEMQGWRVVDLDTGAVFRLSGFLPPLWTPDGRFVDLSDRLFRDSMRGMRDVSWSADNRHFTYLLWTSRFEAIRIDTTAVWIANSETGNAWQVHPRTQNGGQPAWSPDGTTLAYVELAFDIAFAPSFNGRKGGERPVRHRSILHLVRGNENIPIFEFSCPFLDCELTPVWISLPD